MALNYSHFTVREPYIFTNLSRNVNRCFLMYVCIELKFVCVSAACKLISVVEQKRAN